MPHSNQIYHKCPCGAPHPLRRGMGLSRDMDIYHPWYHVVVKIGKRKVIYLQRGMNGDDAMNNFTEMHNEYLRQRGKVEKFKAVEAVLVFEPMPEVVGPQRQIEDYQRR